MKTKMLLLCLSFAALSFTLSGCGSHEKRNETKEPTTLAKATYKCPMCEGVTSDKPGKCPKCGMELVKINDAKKDTTKK